MSIFGTKEKRGGGIFLSVMQGSFRQKADEHTEGATSRENKEKKIVWELHHETVIGHIENVYIRKNAKFGNELQILVNNKEAKAKATISVPVSSSYTRKFFMVAGSIDYRAPVEIVPHYFADKKKKEKFVTGWCFYQHGAKDQVAEYINFDDVPKVIKRETVSGDKYDDEEAMEYLYNKFMKVAEKNGFHEPESKSSGDDDDDDSNQGKGSQGNQQYQDDEDEPAPQQRSNKASGSTPAF